MIVAKINQLMLDEVVAGENLTHVDFLLAKNLVQIWTKYNHVVADSPEDAIPLLRKQLEDEFVSPRHNNFLKYMRFSMAYSRVEEDSSFEPNYSYTRGFAAAVIKS